MIAVPIAKDALRKTFLFRSGAGGNYCLPRIMNKNSVYSRDYIVAVGISVLRSFQVPMPWWPLVNKSFPVITDRVNSL